MVNHLAIIMDGNGRWAEERGLTRSDGHRAGARQIAVAAKTAMDAGIKYMTLYAFSTENWKRPREEVSVLMELIAEFAKGELPNMLRDGVRLRTIGRTADLPLVSRSALEFAIEQTKNNDKLTINIALSYGGRAEIVDAVNKIIAEKRSEKINEQDFVSYLYAPDIPDPDLLIRTGGEMRLSNFLLWELSYTEFYVTDTYWPDFNAETLEKALSSFNSRKRRFGGLNKK